MISLLERWKEETKICELVQIDFKANEVDEICDNYIDQFTKSLTELNKRIDEEIEKQEKELKLYESEKEDKKDYTSIKEIKICINVFNMSKQLIKEILGGGE